MKKLNSSFKTAFISEAGANLINNDYFAFVELDDYACYAIADGITDLTASEGAKAAVENIILHFQQNPSLSKRALRSYLRAANRELLNATQNEHLKASVTVIVTDYEAIRYASAGNARFRLYREGTLKAQSLDMSLSQDLVEEEEITPNVLSSHEERHNLYTYLGQKKDFRPYVSDKLDLMNADIIVLYTHGIWENLDDADLDDIFAEATDDPKAPLDNVEDMLLSKQPSNLESYTVAAIFVDKIFVDPNRKRRIRRIIKITIIVLLILLIVGIIGWILYSRHVDKVEEMNLRTENTIACIQDNNYIRALDECKKAKDKAENLKDKEKIAQLTSYQRLIESIIAADDAYQGKKFDDAYEGFQTAKERSRYADNLAAKYIERRLGSAEDNLTVSDLIGLGDKLLEKEELDKAEARYIEAKDLAAKLHSAEGKQQAKDALEKVYAAKEKKKAEDEKKDKKKLADDLSDLITMGDNLSKGGDFAAAEEKYLAARNLAAAKYDADGKKEALAALEKLHADKGKAAEAAQKEAEKHIAENAAAAEIHAKGDIAFAAGDYSGAAVYYNTALEKYTVLADTAAISILSGKLQTVALKEKAQEAKIAEAAFIEEQGKMLYAQKEYQSAKQTYQKAQQAYMALGRGDKADEIKAIIDQIDVDAAIMETMPE